MTTKQLRRRGLNDCKQCDLVDGIQSGGARHVARRLYDYG